MTNETNQENTNLSIEDQIRQQFIEKHQKNLTLNTIAGVPQREGWIRKGVITNYPGSAGPELVRNVLNHYEAGYRVYLSTDQVKDERAFSCNTNTRPNTIPAPVTGKTSEGYEFIIMEIETHKAYENALKKKNADELERLRTIKGTVETKESNEGKVMSVKDIDTKFE